MDSSRFLHKCLQLVGNYLDPILEVLVYQDCLAVSNISQAGQFYVTQLQV